jgi:hypothetical protein
MKTARNIIAALVCAFVLISAFAVPLLAQDTSSSPAATSALVQPETAAAIAQPFIVSLAAQFPWVFTVLAVVGGLRFFFKPVVSLIEAYVRSTPQKSDDEFFDQVNHSTAFKIFAWLLDFVASVKVGPQFTAQPKKPEGSA